MGLLLSSPCLGPANTHAGSSSMLSKLRRAQPLFNILSMELSEGLNTSSLPTNIGALMSRHFRAIGSGTARPLISGVAAGSDLISGVSLLLIKSNSIFLVSNSH